MSDRPKQRRPQKSNRRSQPRQGSRRPPAKGWKSRLAAAELLVLVLRDGLDMDAALEASETHNQLEGSDRGFARAMTSAALRALGRIDRALEGFLDRGLNKLDNEVLALLRIGCAQLWVLESPAYAVVSATVDAARYWTPAKKGGGLINAILRRADREKDAYTSLPASTIWPDWLTQRLVSALGQDKADAIARLQLQEPHTDITVKTDPDNWAETLDAELLASGSVRLPTGAPITILPGYADGDWWVQDAGATIAAKLFSDISGKHVADLCAAPGGKTLQLANAGAMVTALDVSEARLARVQENLERTGLKAIMVTADALEWRPDLPLDAILLDAPCSALGTLRRHPEGAWRRSPKSLSRYPDIQFDLANSAHAMLKTGGELVYCVCTPLPEEGEMIVDKLIANGLFKRREVSKGDIPGFDHTITEKGDLLTTPPLTSDADETFVTSDIFYVARLEKV